MVRPFSLASCAIAVVGLLAASSPAWAIGVEEGGKKPPQPKTVPFQPVLWEPYIPEFYVKPLPNADGLPKAVLNMEKPEGELPGIHQAWKSLKQRYGFDNLGGRNDAMGDIVSGWTRSETGFLVHAASQVTPSGDAKLPEQMLAEAGALFYAAVGIDFGDKKLTADKEAYLLGKYFKVIELKITAHEIETKSKPLKIEEIRGPSSSDPFMTLYNYEFAADRGWTQLQANLTAIGAPDRQLEPWRVGRLVEMRIALETEGRLDDAEQAERKKMMGAIRFVVLDPKSVDIMILNYQSQKKDPPPYPK